MNVISKGFKLSDHSKIKKSSRLTHIHTLLGHLHSMCSGKFLLRDFVFVGRTQTNNISIKYKLTNISIKYKLTNEIKSIIF